MTLIRMLLNKWNQFLKWKKNVAYWTKNEFEKVISKIYIEDFYEHMCFVKLWVYYMTGVRVNEWTALWWNDVDFEKNSFVFILC